MANRSAQDTAGAFIAARQADKNGYHGDDLLAFWEAVRRERWDVVTQAAVRVALSKWQAAGAPGR